MFKMEFWLQKILGQSKLLPGNSLDALQWLPYSSSSLPLGQSWVLWAGYACDARLNNWQGWAPQCQLLVPALSLKPLPMQRWRGSSRTHQWLKKCNFFLTQPPHPDHTNVQTQKLLFSPVSLPFLWLFNTSLSRIHSRG